MPTNDGTGTNLVGRVLREPFFQFLAIGIVLFGANYLLHRQEADDTPQKIDLTRDDIRQLTVAWMAQGRPAPTPTEIKSLVDQKVALEVLVREAKTLGLDKEDEIIKRRLAQKMDFLFEDVAKAQDPTNAELRTWYASNAQQFAEPPRIAFRHLYFALDRGQDQAIAAKLRLAGKPEDDATVKLAAADTFMFQDVYTDSSPEQVAREFGPAFAKTVFSLPKGSWQGPVASGYGWHLVWVEAVTPGKIPHFEEVEPKVKIAWLDDTTSQLKRKAFDAMKARYTVTTPPLDDPTLVQIRPVSGSEP